MSTKVTNSQTISKIFRSRKIFLEQAEKKGYDTSDYNNFSINEIAVLYTNNQLDLLLIHSETKKKMFLKYQLLPKLRTNHIYDYIEDLFNIDELLTKEDDLIIVTKENRNDNLTNFLDILYKKDKYYINVYNLNDFMSNILENDLVPPHRILSDEEKVEIKQKYNIIKDNQFPEISRFDPIAVIYGIRPGQVFEIIRSSPTALKTKYYRLCI
jgi:DNA-directed RNA polymerase subunit H (RpoH/RPB5)